MSSPRLVNWGVVAAELAVDGPVTRAADELYHVTEADVRTYRGETTFSRLGRVPTDPSVFNSMRLCPYPHPAWPTSMNVLLKPFGPHTPVSVEEEIDLHCYETYVDTMDLARPIKMKKTKVTVVYDTLADRNADVAAHHDREETRYQKNLKSHPTFKGVKHVKPVRPPPKDQSALPSVPLFE